MAADVAGDRLPMIRAGQGMQTANDPGNFRFDGSALDSGLGGCAAVVFLAQPDGHLVFLSADKYPPPKRAAFLRAYIERMGDKASDKTQKDVEQARRALAQLEADGA